MCVTHPQILKLDRLQPHPSGLPVPKAISASGAHLLPSHLRAGGESLISKGQWVAYWQKGGYALKKKNECCILTKEQTPAQSPWCAGSKWKHPILAFLTLGPKARPVCTLNLEAWISTGLFHFRISTMTFTESLINSGGMKEKSYSIFPHISKYLALKTLFF